jgi:hypothetical protein
LRLDAFANSFARPALLPLPRGERVGVRGFGSWSLFSNFRTPSSCPSPLWGEGTQRARPRSFLFAPQVDACMCRTCSSVLAARFDCVRVLPKPSSRKAIRTKSQAHEKPRAFRVERREAPGSWATPRGRMLPPAHASGVARATERSACANRLLRARCASRRSTTIAVLCRDCRPPPRELRSRSAGPHRQPASLR